MIFETIRSKPGSLADLAREVEHWVELARLEGYKPDEVYIQNDQNLPTVSGATFALKSQRLTDGSHVLNLHIYGGRA